MVNLQGAGKRKASWTSSARPIYAWMVPGARIELATPAFSGRRSTSELPRHADNFHILGTVRRGVKSVWTSSAETKSFLLPPLRAEEA